MQHCGKYYQEREPWLSISHIIVGTRLMLDLKPDRVRLFTNVNGIVIIVPQ